MTVIVAKREKGKIVLASDNQVTWWEMKLDYTSENSVQAKIYKISNEFAVLCSGRVQEISIFQRYCERSKPKSANENDVFDFMCEFRDFCMKHMTTFSFNSHYIIVFKDKIFDVIRWFEVAERKNHATGGSGLFCANVAIAMWADAIKAVKMAIQFELYCGGEIQTEEIITSTKK